MTGGFSFDQLPEKKNRSGPTQRRPHNVTRWYTDDGITRPPCWIKTNSGQKVKSISRSSDAYLAPKDGRPHQPRNLDPALHPLSRAREYTRALNATKLERLFAKPFIAQLGQGHIDGVYCIAKDWRKLSSAASGSGDGVLKRFDLVSREETFSVHAHEGIVKGLCYTVDGRLLSCSTDKMIKLWESGSREVHSRSGWTILILGDPNVRRRARI